MTDAEIRSDAVEKARAELVAIDALVKCPEYESYFLRRLRERMNAIGKSVLEDDSLSTDEREKRRRVWKEYEDILRMPQSDRVLNERIIAGQLGA